MRIILFIIALLFAIVIMIGPTSVSVCGADEAAAEPPPAAMTLLRRRTGGSELTVSWPQVSRKAAKHWLFPDTLPV